MGGSLKKYGFENLSGARNIEEGKFTKEDIKLNKMSKNASEFLKSVPDT
jgi:hypothetical protein